MLSGGDDQRRSCSGFYDLVADRIPDECRGAVEIELAHGRSTMSFHRVQADAEDVGGPLIGMTLGDELNYRLFPCGQHRIRCRTPR